MGCLIAYLHHIKTVDSNTLSCTVTLAWQNDTQTHCMEQIHQSD